MNADLNLQLQLLMMIDRWCCCCYSDVVEKMECQILVTAIPLAHTVDLWANVLVLLVKPQVVRHIMVYLGESHLHSHHRMLHANDGNVIDVHDHVMHDDIH